MRPSRITAAITLLLLAACAAPHFRGTALVPVRAAPPIALTDASASAWRLGDQTGKNVALFFGYTHCADTCPLALAKLVKARAIADPAGTHWEIAFVTVDPERDTPPVLAAYLKRFGGDVVGLTGSPQAVAGVERAYHIWAQKIPGNRRGSDYGYDEAHSSSIFLIDAHGNQRVLQDASASVASLAHDMRLLNS